MHKKFLFIAIVKFNFNDIFDASICMKISFSIFSKFKNCLRFKLTREKKNSISHDTHHRELKIKINFMTIQTIYCIFQFFYVRFVFFITLTMIL